MAVLNSRARCQPVSMVSTPWGGSSFELHLAGNLDFSLSYGSISSTALSFPLPQIHRISLVSFLRFPFLVILPLAHDIGPDLHCNSFTKPFSSKGSRATSPLHPCGSVGLCRPPSGFPNPQQLTHLLSLLEQNLLSNTPHFYGGWMKRKCWMDFVGAGSGLCLAKHQLS